MLPQNLLPLLHIQYALPIHDMQADNILFPP